MNVLKVRFGKRKIILSVIILLIVLFVGYMYKYQQLVNEGSYLQEERCLALDPLFVQKDQSIQDYTKVYYSTASAEVIQKASDRMIQDFSSTIAISEPWMKKEREYLERWDFKFFIDSKGVDVFNALYDKYMADLNANRAMVNYAKNTTDEKLRLGVADTMYKQDVAQKKLDEKFEIAKNRFDIRSYFIKVPKLRCSGIDDTPSMPVIINGPTG